MGSIKWMSYREYWSHLQVWQIYHEYKCSVIIRLSINIFFIVHLLVLNYNYIIMILILTLNININFNINIKTTFVFLRLSS